jgi:hypothetical protein
MFVMLNLFQHPFHLQVKVEWVEKWTLKRVEDDGAMVSPKAPCFADPVPA